MGPSPLARFFRPASIALVGATERSIWSNSAYENLQRFGFDGRVHLINPKGGQVYGRSAARSCRDLGEPVDAALLMVPESALLEAIADVAAAGIAGAVILSAGFAELGEAGAQRQIQMAQAARAAGIRLLGPNCLGYVNFADRCPLWTNPAPMPFTDQTVAVVSQSGATAAELGQFAQQQHIGFSHMISTGNEADIDAADAIGYLAEDDRVRSIAVFLEAARRPAAFLEAIGRAQRAGKPVVILKVGASAAAAKAAESHTGAMVGDDRVFTAVCRQLGVRRVHTLEDLILTADLLARIGPVATPALAIVALSGGICELATDQAEREGLALAALAPQTLANLRALLPPMATPSNPLDLTGGALLKPDIIEQALREVALDPAVGLVTFVFDAPPEIAAAPAWRVFLDYVGAGFALGGKPTLMLSHNFMPVPVLSREVTDGPGIRYCGAGLAHGLKAIGHLFAWSRSPSHGEPVPNTATAPPARPAGEREVLKYLETCGVPVIPASLATTPDEAVVAAARCGEPVVLKIASPDIAHKTDVGGVALDLSGGAAVHAACSSLLERVRRARPAARIDGVWVSPMRRHGVELFVGTLRDPQWGPVLVVGLGGVFVEALKDTSLRRLPVSAAQVLTMLDELRGRALLDGFRGAPAVDRGALAAVIAAIGAAAVRLGDSLVSLEVNPLFACGAQIEALDGLAIWDDVHAGVQS